MRLSSYLFSLLLAATGPAAFAQSSREAAEAHTLYEKANTDPTGQALRDALARQPAGFYGGENFQPGALRTFDGRYRPVPGLRYHAGLHLLEAQDSINLAVTHLWPVGSLRGFDLGEPGGTGPDALRRFRPRLVKEGPAGTRLAYVEVLTAVDAGPLLLAWLYSSGTDAPAGRLSAAPMLVVGPGTEADAPLRPLDLSQSGVLHLFGKRSGNLEDYATSQHLQYDRPADVARLLDHFNRVAVVK